MVPLSVCKLCRVVVVINGREAIREALVTHSVDFADRPDFYTETLRETLVNKNSKGKRRTDCKILSADWCRIFKKDKWKDV